MEIVTVDRVKYTVPKCDCRSQNIGQKGSGKAWLCSHNTLGLIVANIMQYWSERNKISPLMVTITTSVKVFIYCDKCKTDRPRLPSSVGSYTVYECDICYLQENNALVARPELRNFVNDGTDLSKILKGSTQIINWKCPVCDYIFDLNVKWMVEKQSLCNQCAGLVPMTYEEFVNKSLIIHDKFYSYYPNLVVFVVKSSKITINCPVHGDFDQEPGSHLEGSGCWDCSGNKKMTYERFIEKAKERHKSRYEYPPIDWPFDAAYKTYILCRIHGYFYQSGYAHLAGRGCKDCAGNQRMPYSEFLSRATKLHKNKFAYPLTEPEGFNSEFKISIWCSTHGMYVQRVQCHLAGQQCSACAHGTSKAVDLIDATLRRLNVTFEREKSYPGLRYFLPLRFDFAEITLTRGNFTTRLIKEFDGGQHFSNSFRKGRGSSLRSRMIRDKLKDKYALENGFSLIRIPYTMEKEIPKIIEFFLKCPHEKQFIYTYSHYMDNLKNIFHDALIFEVPCPKIDWSDID